MRDPRVSSASSHHLCIALAQRNPLVHRKLTLPPGASQASSSPDRSIDRSITILIRANLPSIGVSISPSPLYAPSLSSRPFARSYASWPILGDLSATALACLTCRSFGPKFGSDTSLAATRRVKRRVPQERLAIGQARLPRTSTCTSSMLLWAWSSPTLVLAGIQQRLLTLSALVLACVHTSSSLAWLLLSSLASRFR